jgi:SPP1 gp7 family putative phage head morphogenesis protein
MPSELQLADDYAEALDSIASRATENTTRALARSMLRTMKQLRKFYGQFIDPELSATKGADGVTRRPGSYSIADSSAKFKELMRISQDFFPEEQLKILQQRFIQDFTDAVALGGELGQELAQEVDPQAKARAPFVGASRAAVEAAATTASAYIRGEVESFRDNIARIVTDGIGRGKGPRALEKDIRIALQGAKDPDGLNAKMGLKQRAELIARSELANAYVGAQKAAAARNGFQYGRWITTKHENVCKVCASRHGRVYRLSDMVIPGHPRCLCSVSPVSTDAIEEKDDALRKELLRQDYWDRSREAVIKEFANGNGKKIDGKMIPMEFGKASKILEEAIRKPSPSERRQYPDMQRAPEPVA